MSDNYYETIVKLRGIRAIISCFGQAEQQVVDEEYAFMLVSRVLQDCIMELEKMENG